MSKSVINGILQLQTVGHSSYSCIQSTDYTSPAVLPMVQTVCTIRGAAVAIFKYMLTICELDCVGLWQGYYYCVGITPAFEVKAFYSAGCKGNLHGQTTVASGTDGFCFDTNCQVASLDTSIVGDCPSGQVQISYWEKPGCTGKWFGYGYTSRGKCHTLWTEGWKFKAVWLRCAIEQDDCVNRGTCTYDPEPSRGICA